MKESKLLNIAADFKEEIQPKLDRRVHLIAQSVAGGFLGGNAPEETSFRHILNRIMLLAQVPICFVIFRKVPKKEIYIEHYRSNKHPRDITQIEQFLTKGNDESSPLVLKNDYLGKTFNLFGSEYHILVILLGQNQGKHSFGLLCPNHSKKTPTKNSELVAYVLESIFDESHYDSYGEIFKALMKSSIAHCTNDPKKINTINPLIKPSKEIIEDVEKKLNCILLRNKSFTFNRENNGYLDRIYDKFHRNIQHISKFVSTGNISSEYDNEIIPNYVVYIRDYAGGKNYLRHPMQQCAFKGYDYRLRIALSSKQRQSIRSYFLGRIVQLKNSYDLTENTHPQSYSDLTKKHANENIRLLAAELNAYFWRELYKIRQDQNGHFVNDKILDTFLDILEEPLSPSVRSPIDSIFDGQIYFRRAFNDGGIPRCMKDGEVKYSTINQIKAHQPEVFNDLTREVISHYWFEGMMVNAEKDNDINDGHKRATMLIPIEVGGKIWCVLAYNTRIFSDDESEKTTVNMEAQEVTWNQNYHLLQDVVARKKKELRISILNAYLDLLAHYYAVSLQEKSREEMRKITYDEENNRHNSEHFQYESWLNERFSAIAMLLPYDRIEVTIKNGQGGGAKILDLRTGEPMTSQADFKEGVFLTAAYYCSIQLCENDFFPPAPALPVKSLGRFIKETEVVERLSNVTFSRISDIIYDNVQS